MSKFDTVYNEALVNVSGSPNTNTSTGAVSQKPKLDVNLLNQVAQKWNKSKGNNQPLNLNPQEMEALDQLLGGHIDQQVPKDESENAQNPNAPIKQTTTPAI